MDERDGMIKGWVPVLPLVTSSLLSRFDGVVCAMSTRQGGVSKGTYGLNLSSNVGDEERSVLINRERFFGSLGIEIDRLAIPRQVHGQTVRRVDGPGRFDACDALVTNTPRTYLVVSVADCLPIYLFDPKRRAIGLVHAGWRGSKSKILTKTIQLMAQEFGSHAADLRAFIGPGADSCCYEVGEEVVVEFDRKYIVRRDDKRLHLDLKSCNRDLLLDAGVRVNRIEVSSQCTICIPDLFHSYRREGNLSGRMMGVLGLRDTPD